MKRLPDVFNYLDAAQFLCDVFNSRKETEANFSYLSWATELGLGNKTALRFILKRERRITPRFTALFIRNFKFTEDQAIYFRALINYSQAKTAEEKQSFGASLVNLQRKQYKPLEIPSDLITAISPIILSLLSYRDIDRTAPSLAKMINVDEAKVDEALENLRSVGNLKLDKKGFVFEEVGFKIPDSPASEPLRKFHEFWIGRAVESIKLPATERKFRALTLALSDAEFAEVIDRVNDFALTLLTRFHGRQMNNKKLYLLESLLFPITKDKAVAYELVD